jgi:hypothetical protein
MSILGRYLLSIQKPKTFWNIGSPTTHFVCYKIVTSGRGRWRQSTSRSYGHGNKQKNCISASHCVWAEAWLGDCFWHKLFSQTNQCCQAEYLLALPNVLAWTKILYIITSFSSFSDLLELSISWFQNSCTIKYLISNIECINRSSYLIEILYRIDAVIVEAQNDDVPLSKVYHPSDKL